MSIKESNFNEILVISVGATPQVITETLWYYAYNKIRKFDRIVCITTSKGKEKIIEELYDNAWLNKLEHALSLSNGTYVINDEDIIVLSDSDGEVLDDIRTSKDCEDMMTHVFRTISELTDDVQNRLTLVIAGGRKTMPATLALAASIYGRNQDEMIHVLINDELFWSDWYFPTDPKDPKQQIEISQIPYLRMKNFISGINMDDPLEAISITQTRLDEISPLTELIIDQNKIIYNEQEFKFPPAQMQLWRYIARKKIDRCVREDLEFCGTCNECYSTHDELMDEFDNKISDEYFQIVGEGSAGWENRRGSIAERERKSKKRETAADVAYEIDTRVRELKSKLKRTIKKKINEPRLYHQLQLVDEPIDDELTSMGCGLKIEKQALHFINDNVAQNR